MDALEYLKSRSGKRTFVEFTVNGQVLRIRSMTAAERMDASTRFKSTNEDDAVDVATNRTALFALLSLCDSAGRLIFPDDKASLEVIKGLPALEFDVIDKQLTALNFAPAETLAKNLKTPKTTDT